MLSQLCMVCMHQPCCLYHTCTMPAALLVRHSTMGVTTHPKLLLSIGWHHVQAASLHCSTLICRAYLLISSHVWYCFTLHASWCHACCSTSLVRSDTCSSHKAHLLTQRRRQLSLSYGATRAAPIPPMSFILHQHCEWSAATMSPARGGA